MSIGSGHVGPGYLMLMRSRVFLQWNALVWCTGTFSKLCKTIITFNNVTQYLNFNLLIKSLLF